MDKYKITENEINENNVKSAADLLKGEPRDNKNIFDRLPELIAGKVNGFIDAVISKFADYYNKSEINSKENVLNEAIDTKANAADVYKKTETYSKNETEQRINEKVTELGAGDMAKAVYDTDGDGVVDDAEKLNGQPASYYAKAENGVQTYTQSAGTLTGSGTNGKFKATATGTYTAFTIGGVSYAVKAGSETEIELTSGVWYSFILDTGAKTINFKAGGAGLNFKIVGGTTQPTSPKENTIWINTSTAIKEYQFSATEPTTRADGTALQNGDVWIEIANDSVSAFNALKKNSIQLSPIRTCQWNGTSWTYKLAQIYKNGAWVNVRYDIIVDGKENTTLTGGFYISSSVGIYNISSENGKFTVYAKNSGNSTGYCESRTTNKLATKMYNTLYIDIEWSSTYYAVNDTVYLTIVDSGTGRTLQGSGNRQTIAIDISKVTKDCQIQIGAQAWVSSEAYAHIYNAWLA